MHDEIEQEHLHHDKIFKALDQWLASALSSRNHDLRIEFGREFCVAFQRFEGQNLLHQAFEESVIMPELHKLYSDEEILARVDGPVYNMLSSEDLIGMMLELFPHFNAEDRYGMLNDIRLSQPAKFRSAWEGVMPSIDENECSDLAGKLF